MNRIQRRGRVPRQNDSLNRFKHSKIKGSNGINALHSPLRKPRSKDKTGVNRCCYVTPDKRDFGQYYTALSPRGSKRQITQRTDDNQFRTLLQDQYCFDPGISTITRLNKLNEQKVSSDKCKTVETNPQYAIQRSGNSPISVKPKKWEAAFDDWQKMESIEDVDKLITSSGTERPSKHIFISEVPHVKVIAEKFSKYKRGNLELRRLDEKVVCVEYDIFNQSPSDEHLKPVQRMRAFFSIKPSFDNDSCEKQGLPRLPSNIKNEFDVLEDDLKKLTNKEIEFIDAEIEENKSYLEGLRRILKRKKVIKAQKNKTTLDLQSLYEMARRDRLPLSYDFSETNLLSKAELQEVKDLILLQCTSSVHGFRRRTIKKKEKVSSVIHDVISESIMAELLR